MIEVDQLLLGLLVLTDGEQGSSDVERIVLAEVPELVEVDDGGCHAVLLRHWHSTLLGPAEMPSPPQ